MATNGEFLLKFRKNADKINERVNKGIEEFRKSDITLSVTDKNGKPLSNAKIHINHVKHEFLHGANIFMLDEMESDEKNKKYKSAFTECFNEATIPFYWKDLEPEEGKLRFDKNSPKIYRRPAPDLCLEFCEENNITPKAHCLTYVSFEPDWLDKNNLDEVRAKYEKRYKEISERYKDRIHGWEVINETICMYPKMLATPYFTQKNLVEESFKLAEKYFPENELIINEAPWFIFVLPHFIGDRSPYYMLIERALSKGARIDTIGIQFHDFVTPDTEKNYLEYMYNPDHIYRVLDLYASFGLPIQITEVTVPAFSDEKEDLQMQAEVIEWLYKIWFGHPAVEAAIYWNLVDGYAYAPSAEPGDMTAGENCYRGGLLDFSLNKKPAYETLRRLFREEWTTNEILTSGDDGRIEFRGFFGEYDIEIDGKHYHANISKNTEPDANGKRNISIKI